MAGELPLEEGDLSKQKPKRTIPQALRDRFTCRTCNALCIGYIRLEGHFAKYPDHERPGESRPLTDAGPRNASPSRHVCCRFVLQNICGFSSLPHWLQFWDLGRLIAYMP